MEPEQVEVLRKGEEILERAHKVAQWVEERTEELTHNGGRGPTAAPERTAVRPARRAASHRAPAVPQGRPAGPAGAGGGGTRATDGSLTQEAVAAQLLGLCRETERLRRAFAEVLAACPGLDTADQLAGVHRDLGRVGEAVRKAEALVGRGTPG